MTKLKKKNFDDKIHETLLKKYRLGTQISDRNYSVAVSDQNSDHTNLVTNCDSICGRTYRW